MGRSPSPDSLWQCLENFPPAVIRLAARRSFAGKNVRALSNQEIAIESGIRLDRVLEISYSTSWENVTIGEAELFCSACGFDPTRADHRRRQREYIRVCQIKYPNRPPQYLTASPHWMSQILPLIRYLRSHQSSSPVSEEPRSIGIGSSI